MYYVLFTFTFMQDIEVFCFVYISLGYRCILFCLRVYRISVYFICLRVCRISKYFVLFICMWDIDVCCFVYISVGY